MICEKSGFRKIGVSTRYRVLPKNFSENEYCHLDIYWGLLCISPLPRSIIFEVSTLISNECIFKTYKPICLPRSSNSSGQCIGVISVFPKKSWRLVLLNTLQCVTILITRYPLNLSRANLVIKSRKIRFKCHFFAIIFL